MHQKKRRIHSGQGLFGSFDVPWSERSWIDLFSKETQNPFSDFFGFKNPILDFLKETHPIYYTWLCLANENTWSPKQFSKMTENSKILLVAEPCVCIDIRFHLGHHYGLRLYFCLCLRRQWKPPALKFSNKRCRSRMKEWSIIPQEVFFSVRISTK